MVGERKSGKGRREKGKDMDENVCLGMYVCEWEYIRDNVMLDSKKLMGWTPNGNNGFINSKA